MLQNEPLGGSLLGADLYKVDLLKATEFESFRNPFVASGMGLGDPLVALWVP